MGLDMYLTKKTYVKQWEHQKPEEKHNVAVTKGGKPTGIKSERVSEVIEEIGYWRKANQIHKWFVDNVVENEDWSGEDAYASREQLQILLDTCIKVRDGSTLIAGKIQNGSRGTPKGWEPIMEDGKLIENSTLAQELLPTEDGFFFGSTEYNQFYMDDVNKTIEILTAVLAEPVDSGSFYYSASW